MANKKHLLNITKTDKGKFDSNKGTAHEFYVAGILMRLGFDVSVSSMAGVPYDLIVSAFEKGPSSRTKLLRVQVKTAKDSVSFIGGVRGGADRAYTSTEKELVEKKYKYSEEHNDLITGVQLETLDIYLIPTKFLKKFGESKSIKLLSPLKNNWDILLNWNDKYLDFLAKKIK